MPAVHHGNNITNPRRQLERTGWRRHGNLVPILLGQHQEIVRSPLTEMRWLWGRDWSRERDGVDMAHAKFHQTNHIV